MQVNSVANQAIKYILGDLLRSMRQALMPLQACAASMSRGMGLCMSE